MNLSLRQKCIKLNYLVSINYFSIHNCFLGGGIVGDMRIALIYIQFRAE